MLQGETGGPKTVEEITEKALKQTESAEPVGLQAKQNLKKEVENDEFLRDWREGVQYGLRLRKPMYEEDE